MRILATLHVLPEVIQKKHSRLACNIFTTVHAPPETKLV